MSSLTWRELTRADDFLTLNLIDNIDYWIKTRKISRINPSFQIPQDVIYDLLKKYIIEPNRPDYKRCLHELMKQTHTRSFVKDYFHSANSLKEFKKHAKRYLDTHRKDCGFDFEPTDRYKLKTHELETCVVARKKFVANEEIRFLEGQFAELDGVAETILSNKDFSVFNTTSSKASKLMLGPCRFVNHNCEPNAKFSPNGQSGLKVIAIKPIFPGEEITVAYAPNYFGEGNRHCLCAACERRNQGFYNRETFFDPDLVEFQDVSSTEELSDDDNDGEGKQPDGLTFIRTRKRKKTRSIEDDPETILIEIGSGDDDDENDGADDDDDDDIDGIDDDFSAREGSANSTDPSDYKDEVEIITERPRARNEGRRQLNLLRMEWNENLEILTAKTIGGRKLRSRDVLRHLHEVALDEAIISYSPDNDLLDSMEMETRSKTSSNILEQRKINRRLHRFYFIEVYKIDADRTNVYDCRNCGIYFEYSHSSKYKEYCPRCLRHQKLFGLAWPHTTNGPFTTELYLDSAVSRHSIGNLQRYSKDGASQKRIIRQRLSRIGLQVPLVKGKGEQTSSSTETSPGANEEGDYVQKETTVKSFRRLKKKRQKVNRTGAFSDSDPETVGEVEIERKIPLKRRNLIEVDMCQVFSESEPEILVADSASTTASNEEPVEVLASQEIAERIKVERMTDPSFSPMVSSSASDNTNHKGFTRNEADGTFVIDNERIVIDLSDEDLDNTEAVKIGAVEPCVEEVAPQKKRNNNIDSKEDSHYQEDERYHPYSDIRRYPPPLPPQLWRPPLSSSPHQLWPFLPPSHGHLGYPGLPRAPVPYHTKMHPLHPHKFYGFTPPLPCMAPLDPTDPVDPVRLFLFGSPHAPRPTVPQRGFRVKTSKKGLSNDPRTNHVKITKPQQEHEIIDLSDV